MASPPPWITSPVTWGLTILAWWMSPTITFFLNKLFSYLVIDTSRKLRDLEREIIPKLKLTLSDAEEQWMLRQVDQDKRSGSDDLTILKKIMKDLKFAWQEAEHILDLVDYYKIKKRGTGYGPAGACISRFMLSCSNHLRCIVSWVNVRRGAWISHCKNCFRRSTDSATTANRNSSSADDVSTSVTIIDADSLPTADAIPIAGEGSTTISSAGAAVLVTAEPASSSESVSLVVHRLCVWCSSIVAWIIKGYLWILTSLLDAYVKALYYRDWSTEAFGIRNNKEDGMALDSFMLTVYRMGYRKRIQKIEDILNDSRKSHLLDQQSNRSENSVRDKIRGNYRSIGLEHQVFGRVKERKDICRMLRDGPSTSSSSKCYYVIGIHGIAGSGKSTLAQYVYDYEYKLEGNEKHFDRFMFINVSGSSCIFRDMLQQVKNEDNTSPANPQEKLKEELKDRCFLLVLDDVWVNSKNRKQLSDLHAVLNCGKIGSRVLVTAQIEDAARILDADVLIAISPLEEKDYFSLFMYKALKVTCSLDGTHREIIGRRIAEKLHRSPIAAVTVAARLRMNQNIEFWERTANLDLLKETRGALWWTYQQLDADIRQCFASLSIFPRAYELERDELIGMWAAQGFLKTSNEEYEMEDLGQDYLDKLVALSFLQAHRTHTGCFTVHDLLHGLAEEVAQNDFFRMVLDGPPKDIPPGVCHLFIDTNNLVEVDIPPGVCENLRTLIIKDHSIKKDRMSDMERNPDLEKTFERLFMRLRKLRVLIIEIEFGELLLPASIDQMKGLRYLGFHLSSNLEKVVLPSTINKLYHMQTIRIPFLAICKFEYPDGVANLIHLRHVPAYLELRNVGRLTSLQTMENFSVNKEQGYELRQLKNLNKLRGTLSISGLWNVESKEEALEADLVSKEGITKLSLSFGFDRNRTMDPDIEAEVLEGLCPPKYLQELSITGFKGSRYPSWMLSCQHVDAPMHLRKLSLRDCSRLASIPEDSVLVRRLLELRIYGCDWDSLPENMDFLKSLQVLNIGECGNMEVLPTLPPSLNEINIYCCRVLDTTCREEGHENYKKIQRIPSATINCRFVRRDSVALDTCPILSDEPLRSLVNWILRMRCTSC